MAYRFEKLIGKLSFACANSQRKRSRANPCDFSLSINSALRWHVIPRGSRLRRNGFAARFFVLQLCFRLGQAYSDNGTSARFAFDFE
jgi:hypothetical protein